MVSELKRLARRLRKDVSGNAMILVSLGMPTLIGGAGLAVDTAQWYMWKRELQYAVDQAAIAGAWSRAKNRTGTSYQQRAAMEFSKNQEIVNFAAAPSISLVDYAGGDDNSVLVTTTATRMLPFTGFLTGNAATIAVRAQASFEEGESYTSCLLAIEDHDSGAITIGGNATLTASCGMAALSDSPNAVVVNGNPQVDIGWILAAGGIDDWFDDNTDDDVHENLAGLVDPFSSLTPPNNPTARTYGCATGGTSTTATVATTTTITTRVYSGRQQNSLSLVSTVTGLPVITTVLGISVANGTVAGTTTTATTASSQSSTGSGQNRIYTRTDRTTTITTTISNVVATVTSAGAYMLPGTYASFVTRCNTTMSPGVYVLDGGNFEVRAQDIVTGNGVIIVLKNGAGIRINGGANVNLTAATASQLMSAGVSSSEASRLAGMLVFEDRASTGSDRNLINGNASTTLNGTIYLPRSNMTFSGTAGVTSQCLMIAAATITITGTAQMESFCPAGVSNDAVVATTIDSVRLVG